MRVCEIVGCERAMLARGYCSMHYQRLMKHGDPVFDKFVDKNGRPMRVTDGRAHFWSKVSFGSGCWEWQCGQFPNGYGQHTVTRQNQLAHRVAWQFVFGPLSVEQCVLHECDNRICVRPTHLFLGDRPANQRDMAAKGRAARGERNEASKLRLPDILLIRASEAPAKVLAAQFGVHASQVRRIRNRLRWTWVA